MLLRKLLSIRNWKKFSEILPLVLWSDPVICINEGHGQTYRIIFLLHYRRTPQDGQFSQLAFECLMELYVLGKGPPVLDINQSKAREHCFLSSDWLLTFGTLRQNTVLYQSLILKAGWEASSKLTIIRSFWAAATPDVSSLFCRLARVILFSFCRLTDANTENFTKPPSFGYRVLACPTAQRLEKCFTSHTQWVCFQIINVHFTITSKNKHDSWQESSYSADVDTLLYSCIQHNHELPFWCSQ